MVRGPAAGLLQSNFCSAIIEVFERTAQDRTAAD